MNIPTDAAPTDERGGDHTAQLIELHPRNTTPLPSSRWTAEGVQALFDKPFMELLLEAQIVHRLHWPEGEVELTSQLSALQPVRQQACGCPLPGAESQALSSASCLRNAGRVLTAHERHARSQHMAVLATAEPQLQVAHIHIPTRTPQPAEAMAPDAMALDDVDLAYVVAVARITMPRARLRLTVAGPRALSDTTLALCFLAGANGICYSDLGTEAGPHALRAHRALLSRLGLKAKLGGAVIAHSGAG